MCRIQRRGGAGAVWSLTILLSACCGRAYSAEGCYSQAKDLLVPGSCTIFAAAQGDMVLFGNNEDWKLPTTFYWVRLPGQGTYGGVYLGHRSEEEIRARGLAGIFAQGGVNEKGLAFDYAALPNAPMKPDPDLPAKGEIMMRIQERCATVTEAIALAKKHNWGTTLRWQVLLADATGDAVVISAGKDGELAFTRKPPGDGYLLTTNFNRSNPENTFAGSYPCWRYDRAARMLEQVGSSQPLTVDFFRSILEAVHIEGAVGNTEYSNVIELRDGVIHLNHWHQYDETASIHVAEEIAKHVSGRRSVGGEVVQPVPVPIKNLFTRQIVERAEREHQAYQHRQRQDE